MEGRYLLVLRDGLEERSVVRAFMDKIHPGSTIYVEGERWVVIRIHERAQMLPEALAVPAKVAV
jgi:hypothetical protein